MIADGALGRLGPGFDDPVLDAQEVFRLCLSAMAHPGRIHPLGSVALSSLPRGLHRSAAALLLALLDQDTTLWLSPTLRSGDSAAFLRFHTGCALTTEPGLATFALVDEKGSLPPLAAFAQGTEAYPDRSTTVVLQCQGLRAHRGWTLTGPGIEDSAALDVDALEADFLERWNANRAVFPRGIDLFLAAPDAIAALPRTVRVEA